MPKLPILVKGKIRHAPYHPNDYSPFSDRVRKTFKEHLPKQLTGCILDAGCSYGRTTREIAYLYPEAHVIGIDVNEEVLPEDVLPPLEFRVGNFYLLPRLFPPRAFDAIFAMNNFLNVVKDMYRTEIEAVLQGFLSRLKEKGYLLMSAHKGGELVLMKNNNAFQVLWAGETIKDTTLSGVLPDILGPPITYPLLQDREQRMRVCRRRFGI